MTWYELYGNDNQPTAENIKEFINNPLWDELCSFIENKYSVKPKAEYSGCSMQKGWNIKYKKKGKSICTLYPIEGYFIALVVVGGKEQMEAELVLSACSEYTRKLYQSVPPYVGGRWLMMDVKGEDVLEDVKRLIQLRV